VKKLCQVLFLQCEKVPAMENDEKSARIPAKFNVHKNAWCLSQIKSVAKKVVVLVLTCFFCLQKYDAVSHGVMRSVHAVNTLLFFCVITILHPLLYGENISRQLPVSVPACRDQETLAF
jgi:hypothetical protein